MAKSTMQSPVAPCCAVLLMNLRNARLASRALGGASDPVAKVLEMLSGLLAKIVAEAGGVTKTYDEFAEWCEDKFEELRFEIRVRQGEVDQPKADIMISSN